MSPPAPRAQPELPSSSAPESQARAIRERALQLGFDQVGFCDAARPPEMERFERWLDAGMHGAMGWLERGRARRLDPRLVLDGARSFIVVTQDYAREPSGVFPLASDPAVPRGGVSRYAAGPDYHRDLGERLAVLERFVETAAPGHRALAYVDTGPLLERLWAARAGIGWIGKNAMVLNKEHGSYFFLGVILTTLPLPPAEPASDQCGSCTLCVEACPTGAIVDAGVVDSRRCIAYHTIELRGPVPEEHRAAIASRVFGCDDCQDVCPWNRPVVEAPALDLSALLTMTQEEYQARFHDSAMRRATWQGLRRNAALAMGNAGDASALPLLSRVAADEREDEVVREQAAWSAARLSRS